MGCVSTDFFVLIWSKIIRNIENRRRFGVIFVGWWKVRWKRKSIQFYFFITKNICLKWLLYNFSLIWFYYCIVQYCNGVVMLHSMVYGSYSVYCFSLAKQFLKMFWKFYHKTFFLLAKFERRYINLQKKVNIKKNTSKEILRKFIQWRFTLFKVSNNYFTFTHFYRLLLYSVCNLTSCDQNNNVIYDEK